MVEFWSETQGRQRSDGHSPATLLNRWPRKQRCTICQAERYMHGIFSITPWLLPDGSIAVVCPGRPGQAVRCVFDSCPYGERTCTHSRDEGGECRLDVPGQECEYLIEK